LKQIEHHDAATSHLEHELDIKQTIYFESRQFQNINLIFWAFNSF